MSPDSEFLKWMNKVDAVFERLFGMTSMDFPDWDWWDAWEEGLTPEVAVDRYLTIGANW